jgi:hypothetical protein
VIGIGLKVIEKSTAGFGNVRISDGKQFPNFGSRSGLASILSKRSTAHRLSLASAAFQNLIQGYGYLLLSKPLLLPLCHSDPVDLPSS